MPAPGVSGAQQGQVEGMTGRWRHPQCAPVRGAWEQAEGRAAFHPQQGPSVSGVPCEEPELLPAPRRNGENLDACPLPRERGRLQGQSPRSATTGLNETRSTPQHRKPRGFHQKRPPDQDPGSSQEGQGRSRMPTRDDRDGRTPWHTVRNAL